MNKLIFIIFLIVLLNMPDCCSQSEARLSNKQLVETYFNILKKINSPVIDIDKIKSSDLDIYSSKDKNNPKKHLINIQSYNAMGMEIDPNSGQIMELYNNSAAKKRIIHDGADKPSKDKDWALKEAERYLIVINGKIPENIYQKDIKFVLGSWYDNKHSYDGSWTVWWGRKDGEYKFREDAIAIAVYEKLGFDFYNYSFFSDYHPPKDINITKDAAIKIAGKNINKILRSPLFREMMRDYKIGKFDSAEPMIVNPNYASIKSGDFHTYAISKSYARLAWVVKYNHIANPSSGWPDAFFGVWIDAETGEILGGDGEEKRTQTLQ